MRTLRPPVHLEGLDLYEPGKPIEEVQRESGLRDVVKLASARLLEALDAARGEA